MYKTDLVNMLDIKVSEESGARTRKFNQDMEYLDLTMPYMLEAFKKNIEEGIFRIVVKSATDRAFSNYTKINGELIWLQRRFPLLKGYICSYWTMLGYKCTMLDHELIVQL